MKTPARAEIENNKNISDNVKTKAASTVQNSQISYRCQVLESGKVSVEKKRVMTEGRILPHR